MKKHRDSRSRFTDSPLLQQPPLLELLSNHRVLLENHMGIIGYDTNVILVKVKNGRICIRGGSLHLACMTSERLVITGCISSIEYHLKEG